MTERPPYTVTPVDWNSTQQILKAIRTAVFVEEQGVPEALEWDGLDEDARHVVALAPDGAPIGTGRLLPDGRIGRMAVLKAWRGKRVGWALLDALVAMASRSGHAEVNLHAQTRVVEFYRRRGFAPHGGEFLEAGIPHIAMTRSLTDQAS